MDKLSLQFLADYLNNFSPTGFEVAGQKLWMNFLKPYVDEFITDSYGTAVGVINPGQKYKVVIEAHADEISWFVNYIDAEGFIFVVRNGGSDHQIAPSQRVNVFTDKGIVRGVFGWPAIHTRQRDKEEVPKLDNIFIDIGAKDDKEVARMGVKAGDVVTFTEGFEVLNNRYYIGRALDNRIGGFMIARVAKKLKESKKKLPYTLYVVNSVQEEIGLRGAEMIARRLNPDVAIITDVTHDTQTPLIEKQREGDIWCGKGPVLMIGPAIHNQLLSHIRKAGERKKIPLQFQPASRSTGTDTESFAYSNNGVPSALISLPLRYMHTTVEMVKPDDVEHVINLIHESLVSLKAGTKFNYHS